ncbi:cache domain-containing protein [Methanospirillum lacunae]|uniref:Sodium:calcium antiporter n=1 Tax=Methanospirillum lacunae TaxID=668570 RepID=A0A2V2N3E1_9EURY|nr:cache domain-containing protein [Methanospirillum lacunae]PWR74704.1 sodium:calcium antiporter [Methanospirillum lacunae]
MRGIKILLCLLIVYLLLVMAGAEQNNAVNDSRHQDMKNLIGKISDEITSGLEDVERANEKSAKTFSNGTLEGEYVSTVLNDKVSAIPFAHSSLVILPSGLVTAAAPAEYQNLVGMSLNDTAVITANKKKRPVLSDIFLLTEGFYGVSLSYPIFSPEKNYLGYTDLTFRPEEFLRQYIIPAVEQSRYDIMILQPNGLIVYETNEEEIGRDAISDPLYAEPTLHQAAINITSQRAGTSSYQFWNQNWNKKVPREAIWDTLEFDGQQWRIVVISDIGDSEPVKNLKINITTEKTEDLNSSILSLTEYMENATDYAKNHGKKEVLSVFNNQSGPFVTGDRYIFAYDMNGTALALPFQQGFIGKNRMNLTDVNGFSILPAMIDRASDGGGYLYFVYPNPAENYTPMLKLFQVKPVDDSWFIGSGIYIPQIQASISPQNLSDLNTRVKKAAMHADDIGKEKAIADFNDINGTYADGGDYIFAYGYDGTTLALPHQPELIGTNRSDYTDQFGCQIIRMEIDAAKRGGGYVYVVYGNPDTKKNELKLCYVTPAGDDWLVGSGIYTGQNLDG